VVLEAVVAGKSSRLDHPNEFIESRNDDDAIMESQMRQTLIENKVVNNVLGVVSITMSHSGGEGQRHG
jgi:hypothetical protein